MLTDTVNLQTLPPPPEPSTEVAKLLHELVTDTLTLPNDAREVFDRDELPISLRRLAHIAESLGQTCSCWRDNANRFWFFAAQMMHELSAERGMPMLRLDRFEGDEGVLLESAVWVLESPGDWCRVMED